MECVKCGVETGSSIPMCKSCIGDKKKNREKALNNFRVKREETTGESLKDLLSSNAQWLALIFAAVVLYMYNSGVFGFGNLPKTNLPAYSWSKIDPCLSAEKCVIAYFAPWCPACQGSVGFINCLYNEIEGSNKLAMKVIIGMDEQASLEAMAAKFKAPVFFDPEREFSSKLGIRAVPSVLVADLSGKIIEKKLPGAIYGMESEEENVKYYIKNILKVDLNTQN